MRKLILSLLIVVLIAVLGLGWTLDRLFEYYSNQPRQDELLPYREMGSSLAEIIDLHNDANSVIEQLNHGSDLLLSLKTITEFLLPPELKAGFIQGEPLALESNDGLTLNFYLPRRQQVLTVASPAMLQNADGTQLSLLTIRPKNQ